MKKKIVLSIGLATAIFTGCGGSSDGDSGVSTGTGYYIDSAVSGVDYVCGSQNGKTGSDGSFTFEKGKACTFSLGDMKLREVKADTLKDQIKIIEDNLAVATLLQTLDSDGDPNNNGIVISSKIIEELKAKNITKLPTNQDEVAEVYEVIKNVDGYKGVLKTEEEAQAHLKKSQENAFTKHGTYTENGKLITITRAKSNMNRATPPIFQFNLKHDINDDRDMVQINTIYKSKSKFDNALTNNTITIKGNALYIGMEIAGKGWVGNDSVSDDLEIVITKNNDGTYSIKSEGSFTSNGRIISNINANNII